MDTLLKMHKVYELLPTYDTSKQLILEPLSCVLKLSLLQYKPIGTKISVANNSLKFHEPSVVQGISRRVSGDSRQDLHNICHPIIKCLEWYPLDDPVNAFFYGKCVKGLLTLKDSYESNSIINHTIDHYIGLLEGKQVDEELDDNPVTSSLLNMWVEKEITIMKTMLEHIVDVSDETDRSMYLSAFEQLLIMKEIKVNSYIHSISTSYQ